eukprot:SAG31_NODE_703_length_12720_cov_10.185088_8_plen_114_part_00
MRYEYSSVEKRSGVSALDTETTPRNCTAQAEDGDLDAIFELAVGRLQKAQTRSQIEEGRRALDDIGRCADTGCTAAELFLAQQYVKTSAAVMQAAAYEGRLKADSSCCSLPSF